MQERDIHIIEEDIPKLFRMCRYILNNYEFNKDDVYDYSIVITSNEFGIYGNMKSGTNGVYMPILFSCTEDLKIRQPYIRDGDWLEEIYHSIKKQYRQLRRPEIIKNIIIE